jgi:hypothetical protein
MGCGLPEYVLLFRKPPTDTSNGYADEPVVKTKKYARNGKWENEGGYSRAQWQLDAHGFMRVSGDRLLSGDDLIGLPADQVFKTFRDFSGSTVYDFRHHVEIAESLDLRGALPPTFMLLPPQSWHPDVLTDVVRMRTLNTMQSARNREQHLCPLPIDLAERLINQFSMPGEVVLDPFAGLGTVPYCALRLGRRGIGVELSDRYFAEAVGYCRAAELSAPIPTFFDLIEMEEAEASMTTI